jgi:predicted phosphoribosyltransferase/dienelactone hydrolase
MAKREAQELVGVTAGPVVLDGILTLPEGTRSIVLFAHGSGSGRHSPRNQFVARQLQAAGLATLLLDLLTEEEEAVDQRSARLRFDIDLLTDRLVGATDWLAGNPRTRDLAVGYFGASTGAAAALAAAARRPDRVDAIVSRGGRPDLAGDCLPCVRVPTLLLVGGNDESVLDLNEDALCRLGSETKKLVIVPGASHLFEEPGKLEHVAELACDWFARHLPTAGDDFDADENGRRESSVRKSGTKNRESGEVVRREAALSFRDRKDAGRLLADKLMRYAARTDVVVLGLPRGGVPVAYEVAQRLKAPLDVFLVRKLGVPGQEELAMGAIAPGGVRVLDGDVIRELDIPQEAIDSVTRREQAELDRRERAYRGNRSPVRIRDRIAILVDDGLATGATMHAAVVALRHQGPRQIVVAVPVGAPAVCAEFEDEADEVICVRSPESLWAIGRWYDDFSPTTDDEVREKLDRSLRDTIGGQRTDQAICAEDRRHDRDE